MKVNASITKCLVMTKKEIQGVKDPNQMYYRIGVVREDELGELRCTKEIFDMVDRGKIYDFGFMFNSEYNSLQVDRILRFYDLPESEKPAEPENPADSEKPAELEPAEEKKKGSK